jgi:hypothetical protein
MQHSCHCDSVVIAPSVGKGYTTRSWGWLLARRGYSIKHHYSLCPANNIHLIVIILYYNFCLNGLRWDIRHADKCLWPYRYVFSFSVTIFVFLLLSMYSYCSSMYSYRCLCIFIVVYVYLLLSMYIYCFLCILRIGYPDWGFSVLFPRL